LHFSIIKTDDQSRLNSIISK